VPDTALLQPPVVQSRQTQPQPESQPQPAALVFQDTVEAALRQASIREQWSELHAANPDAHPALHPDAVEAWFDSKGGNNSRAPFVHAVLQAGQLECLGVLDAWDLPVVSSLGWRRSGFRLYAKSMLWRESGSACETDAAAADDLLAAPHDFTADWLQSLTNGQCDRRVSSLYVEALDRQSRLFRALNGCHQRLVWRDAGPLQPRWRIRLPSTLDDYWQKEFSCRSRNTLKRKRKKLANRELKVFSEPEDVPEFLAAASAVSVHTWQSKQLGLRVRNDARERALFTTLARRGAFRGYLLQVDGKPAAFIYTTTHQGTVWCEEMGFLPEFFAFSPGLVLLADVVDDLITCGQFHTIDFGLGHAAYKEFLGNCQSESEDVWLLSRGLSTSAACRTLQARAGLDRCVRSALDRTGLLRRLRRWSRGR
jgi:hypothetical protein